jgi:hypothetical protein
MWELENVGNLTQPTDFAAFSRALSGAAATASPAA